MTQDANKVTFREIIGKLCSLDKFLNYPKTRIAPAPRSHTYILLDNHHRRHTTAKKEELQLQKVPITHSLVTAELTRQHEMLMISLSILHKAEITIKGMQNL